MITRIALSLTMLGQLTFTGCDTDAPRDAATSAPAATVGDSNRAPVDSGAWVASPRRVGAIRTGMRRQELVALVGRPARAGYDVGGPCSYVGGTALPPGVRVMLFDSVVVRIDVTAPGVPTAEGIAVGTREQEVLERYTPDAVVTPHKYRGPEWHYVTVTPPHDTLHRMVFETDGAVVTSYRVGRVPEVQWVEGCS